MKEAWNAAAQDGRLEECVAYFKEHPVFGRLLAGFRDKYASYGAFWGTVTLKGLTGQEMEDLEGFLQKSCHGQKSVSVSAARFEKALGQSKFAGLGPKMLLELYFQEEISGKKEQKKEKEARWAEAFAPAKKKYGKTPAGDWLAQLEDGREDAGAYLLRRHRETGGDMQEVRRLLELGAEMINRFPFWDGRVEYLAVFAAGLTGNPHAFDARTRDGSLLYQLVQWTVRRQDAGDRKSAIFPALQRKRQYLAVGILLDDISNYAMLSGVRAMKKDGRAHSGMDGFLEEGDMLHVPLAVVAGWQQVECPDKEIYIVENPSVYALLARKWKGRRAAMCMNGQPRLSSILILDLLAKTGTKVYYAGDFDPEGLLIAQKIRQYYEGEFAYWHMSVAEYRKSISKELISARRLKMLEKITDVELMGIVQAILEEGAAGYQENIWEELDKEM